ncbi:TetR/AcrR family transcriptional regulator [Pseudomonas sp. BN411]|uniref:TetR/AcrR family transcriptional regulator n=1 Tax=Pseudomonas sp. BN411 TaxID=2567887 RepID=UPI002458ABC1|nr:TetR/AcrR family transcriptional regulator [Pseudomonas sp. BN411]MDH4559551.1 TetR/AcrR family transcriptional regulator [Pseudomonas sp. BN411]
MSASHALRLPKCERRNQLLDAALLVVRNQGTEGLTLCSLAHQVGITHTVVYRHFDSRAGLLIALCEQADAHQVEVLQFSLERAKRDLPGIARAISEAYINHALGAGKELHALQAALNGNEAMTTVQRRLAANHVAIWEHALAPYSQLHPDQLHLRCIALLGAVSAVSGELLRGGVELATANSSLTALILGVAGPQRLTPV